ncbi:MAG: type II toxin-antitoxin system VapC family toxin [Ardenticatenales bacterium]|nr:type II toxin-antitoxin system VapC family toxin [Ardenticatenales bacterium]
MSDRLVVLDASALLALLLAEPGAARVAALLPDATVSAVNLSEVVAKLAEHGMPAAAIRTSIDSLNLDVRDFDARTAFEAGLLRPSTKALGLSLGDRVCLALARELGLPAITTERAWASADVGVAVEVIR